MIEGKISDEMLMQELQIRLKEYKKALHDLKELNQELQTVNKKLIESDALKSHFISNISNEIINPFASIIGLSRNLLMIKDHDWKKVEKIAKLINGEAFSLDFQLKNIFAAAEIEAGEVYPEISNVDVKEVIKGVIDSFEQEIIKKAVDVRFSCSKAPEMPVIFFKTDSEKLRIIMSNLLSNAIKYSYENGIIEIQACLENEQLNLSVKDHGIGISFENQKIIFDRFTRVDTGINSINRGHGLGLSINKAYIDLLEGTIHVESSEGQGTEFHITLPMAKSDVEGYSTNGNELIFSDDEIF